MEEAIFEIVTYAASCVIFFFENLNLLVEYNQGRRSNQNIGGVDFEFLFSAKVSLQWILSIVDMLYSGHLTIADTNFKNKVKLTMVISFENKPHCSGHLFIETPLELRTNGVQYREVPLYFRT